MLERAWLDEAAEAMRPTMIGTLGLEVVPVTTDRIVVKMPYDIALTSLGGTVHAGALVGLADTAAYLAVLNHDEGNMGWSLPVLAHSSLTCLGPATQDVIATTRVVLQQGHRVLVEVILHSEGTTVAIVHAEFRLKGPRLIPEEERP